MHYAYLFGALFLDKCIGGRTQNMKARTTKHAATKEINFYIRGAECTHELQERHATIN